MTIVKPPFNAKYIGYACTQCNKSIDEDERQKIITLGMVQTWCMLCLAIKYPDDKHLESFIHGKNDVIIERNKLF